MKVVISAAAEGDLTDIGDWIAADSPQHAVKFLRLLRDKCLGLAEFPERFPLVQRYAQHQVRRRVCGNYLIFYRIEPAHVVILHGLRGAIDYERILFPD